MTRNDIEKKILQVFRDEFEIQDPAPEDDLREVHHFDSIDAIELLREIEEFLDTELTQDEKKQAMGIRTFNDICDYVYTMAAGKGLLT